MSAEAMYERDFTFEIFNFLDNPLESLKLAFVRVISATKDIVGLFKDITGTNPREEMSKRKQSIHPEALSKNPLTIDSIKPKSSRESPDSTNVFEPLSNIGNNLFGASVSNSTSDELIGGYPVGATSSINNKVLR
jgi:hypothetical protein